MDENIHNSPLVTNVTSDQMAARTRLEELFDQTPLPKDDLLFHLGLYTRSSLLVKFIVMNDL